MKTREKNRGARHRTLIFMYITYLTLSLAPAMVAPTQRTFDQGQPEMQQSMDNMVVRQTVIQKRANNSPKDKDQGVIQKRTTSSHKDKNENVKEMKNLQAVNFKTSHLLAEAEKILKKFPDLKEQQWVHSLIEQMREIETMLETTTQHKHLVKDTAPAKDLLVPKGRLNPHPQPVASVMSDLNPFHNPNSMMSKIQMTSPEISRVLPEDEQSEHQAVTKPVALSRKAEETESDELVRELESLHEENTHHGVSHNSKRIKEIQTTVTPSTPLTSEDNQTKSANEESEKARLEEAKLINEESEKARLEEAKLINELEEFHRHGGTLPKAIVDILYEDSHKTIGSVQNRKINMDEEMKFAEPGMKDRRGMMRLDDLNNEDREISIANMRNMPPYVTHQFPYLRSNHTFPNKHPNMVQGFPRHIGPYFQNIPPLRKAQPYQGYPQNFNQNLQKMNSYNQGKYHELDLLHQQSHNPVVLNQRSPRPQFYYNGRIPPYNYHNYFMRPVSGPYPYVHNWNFQNSTIHLMPPYANNQLKIDTQLSDEMKRELRDGKIIVLSDSVVRSNFQPDKNEKSESITEKPQFQQVDMKNETITEN